MPTNPSAAGESRNPVGMPSGAVVCFGFLTYCLLMMVDDLPPKNGGALVVGSVETVGDDAAIVACILSGWGVPTRLVSTPVGADHYGGTVLEHLKSWGVDTAERVSQGLTTPLEVGILDATGGRTYFQRREPVVLDRLEAPTLTNLAGAGLLYVDWYDGPRVVEAMETAFSQGVPVFLNLESQYQKEPRGDGSVGIRQHLSGFYGRTRSVRKPCRHRAFPDRSGRGHGPGDLGRRRLCGSPGTGDLLGQAPGSKGAGLLRCRSGLFGRHSYTGFEEDGRWRIALVLPPATPGSSARWLGLPVSP